MIKITINGNLLSLPAPPDLKSLLAQEGYDGMVVAVARNGAFVARSAHADTLLEDGDALEILAPMQGG